VDINQRKPILRIKTPTQDLYLDSEGGLMNISTAFSAYVPVLLSEKTLSKKYLKTEIYEFANYVYNDKFLNPLVEQIYIDINGKVEMVPRIGSQIIVLGSTDGYQKKMARLKKLYESGFSKVGWNKYKKIDLTYDNQAVCTRN
jgi:cell division protein FtsQ